MRTTCSLFLLFIGCCFVMGQDITLTPVGQSLCQPGVRHKSPTKGILFDYGLNPGSEISQFGDDDFSANSLSKRFKLKLKAPVILREDFKVIAGWNFYGEEYNIRSAGAQSIRLLNEINDRDLKSSSLSLSVIKPLNHRFYLAVKAQAAYNGDYEGLINFDANYASYNLATILGVKKNADLEWGVGLLFRYAPNNLNRLPVLPFAFYNRTFNEKWGIEAIIPTSIKARYNINARNLLLFGPEFESRNYFINDQTASPYRLRRAEVRLGIDYQRHLGSWFWMELSGGYTHNLNTRFEETMLDQSFKAQDFNVSGSPYCRVGIFISPTKILRNKH